MTSVLYVIQNPTTDEARLQSVFGDYGPLSSVKIMWPRTPEGHARGHHSGFVCFQDRRDAERAHSSMHGSTIDGRTVRVCWGKSVRRVESPLQLLPDQVWGGSFGFVFEPDEMMLRAGESEDSILVRPPLDLIVRAEIDAAAVLCAADGTDASEKKRVEEAINGRPTDDVLYFRWRMHSLSHGDTLTEWRTANFAMKPGGPLWVPPSCSRPRNNPPERKRWALKLHTESSDSEEDDDEKRELSLLETIRAAKSAPASSDILLHLATLDSPLSSVVEEQFEEILRNLTPERESICAAMVFCIDYAAFAGSLIAMIAASAMHTDASLETRLSYLYLLSDILHNSLSVNSQGVWAFRVRFEGIAGILFSCFGDVAKAAHAELGVEFSERILDVLKAWSEVDLFPRDFLLRLESAFRKQVIYDFEPKVHEKPHRNHASVPGRKDATTS